MVIGLRRRLHGGNGQTFEAEDRGQEIDGSDPVIESGFMNISYLGNKANNSA